MRIAIALLALACTACGSAAPLSAGSPSASPLAVALLKYRLVDSIGSPVFCDPDYYPLARPESELASALTNYPAIQADSDTFAAIVAHEHLPSTDMSDAQKLQLYRAWKVLRALSLTAAGSRFSFQYRALVGGGPAIQLVSGSISLDGRISISSRAASGPPPCPICLAATTLIATPDGPIRVTEIRTGTIVWTLSSAGTRVAARVIAVGSTAVPAGHLMVHLVLADGRELLASPGHRTADGRPLGSLAEGEALDGSTIVRWELVPYASERTYDLLPEGPSGDYWADGIPLSSTLKP
jgi:hypothetical protein